MTQFSLTEAFGLPSQTQYNLDDKIFKCDSFMKKITCFSKRDINFHIFFLLIRNGKSINIYIINKDLKKMNNLCFTATKEVSPLLQF